jgi:hypothetical protein
VSCYRMLRAACLTAAEGNRGAGIRNRACAGHYCGDRVSRGGRARSPPIKLLPVESWPPAATITVLEPMPPPISRSETVSKRDAVPVICLAIRQVYIASGLRRTSTF